jgi:ubiquinone/menaquinone biosynthesis C-methylase UbiE
MPFPDASFDMIVWSLAIHNIRNLAGRIRAIEEIARTLPAGAWRSQTLRGPVLARKGWRRSVSSV